jgi:hypothetical protein
MAEYIKREDALKEVDRSLSLNEAYSRIASRIIAADVVEVGRCKDCKHWEEIKHGKGWCTGFAPSDVFSDFDDFCSYGERKE